jgi:uncharacterized protein with ParB-like and HNH nuclease domain
MKSEGKDTLNTYFSSNSNQYVIPFFQRAYVWTEENWSNFWDSIEVELQKYLAEEESEHFIGTIITRDSSGSWKKIPKTIELVDGQQRVTTVSLLLRAIADRTQSEMLREYVMKLLLITDKKGIVHHRVRHSQVDRKYFGGLLGGEDFSALPEGSSNVVDAYRFFYQKMEAFDTDKLEALTEVLLGSLPVISIELDERDDEQEIFDTINSLGVRLTIGELLKNYVFREEALRELYNATWFASFEVDEAAVKFWDTTKTSGRVKRTNLELLLYAFLIIETGKEVRLDKLYRGYKTYLGELDLAERKTFLHKLKDYAKDYANFPTLEELNQVTVEDREKRLFHVVEYLDISTVYPLLLYIYQHSSPGMDRNQCLALLESYLVRRTIAGLSNKNYNRLFTTWIADFKEQEVFNFELLQSTISAADKDTSRMPTDEDVRRGWKEAFLYNKTAREILYLVALSRLDNNKYKDSVRKLLPIAAYSVEHIMPKKWEANWNQPKLTDAQAAERRWWLKRMGNLTLITGNMNSKLRHAGWNTKREELGTFSDLSITTEYLELDVWDETTIEARAEKMGNWSTMIWPGL